VGGSRRAHASMPRSWAPGSRRRMAVWAVTAVVVLAAPGAVDAGRAQAPPQETGLQTPQKEVLVLYSARRDAQLSVVSESDLPRILERGLSVDLDFYTEYLDRTRAADADYGRRFRDVLEVKYRGIRFDVVIAVQDPALQFVSKYRAEIFGDAPVVFLSTNPEPSSPGIERAAGIFAPPAFGGTLDLAAALQPDVKEVFVVTGAGSVDQEYLALARKELRRFESRFRITYLSALPMPQLQARVAALPTQSIVYYLMVYRDGANASFHPLEALDEVVRAANVPVYSWVDSALDHGIVGGFVKDQARQTEAVGKLALRVLGGERLAGSVTETPVLHGNQVDWRQLQRWNISEARVPAGTTVKFRTPGPWQRYRPYFFGTLAIALAQTALIAGLLLQLRRRRQAEAEVHGGQMALQRSNDRIHDLAARLIGAQEAERARIARDLHDDISQQLALLEIDLESLRGAGYGPTDAAAAELVLRARTIASSVHDLSHRLHPAKLRLVGLVSALGGLQREMSLPDTLISFTHDTIPSSLSSDLTLCLFRVAQEALQNALKYSHARHVAVHLGSTRDALTLQITDDGVGFNVDAVWGKGLGLISIAERVEAAGGKFEIDSVPGSGTGLTVRVPLRRHGAAEQSAVEADAEPLPTDPTGSLVPIPHSLPRGTALSSTTSSGRAGGLRVPERL
jgi:signal transduction histidine kinase